MYSSDIQLSSSDQATHKDTSPSPPKVSLPGITSIFADSTSNSSVSQDSLYATRRGSLPVTTESFSISSPTGYSDPGSSSRSRHHTNTTDSPPTNYIASSHYPPSTPNNFNAPTLHANSSSTSYLNQQQQHHHHNSPSSTMDRSSSSLYPSEYDQWSRQSTGPPGVLTTASTASPPAISHRGPPPPYSASAPPPHVLASAGSGKGNGGGGALYQHSIDSVSKQSSSEWGSQFSHSPSTNGSQTLVVVPPAATPPSVAYPTLPPGPPPSDLSTNGNGAVQPPRRRGKLPKQVTETLRTWLMAHSDHPYPTEDEKKMLCNATGLSISQVSNWMINARRRILVPANKAALGPSAPYNLAHRPNPPTSLSLNGHNLPQHYPTHYHRSSYPPPHEPTGRPSSSSYNGSGMSGNTLSLFPPNHSNSLPLPHPSLSNAGHHGNIPHELNHGRPSSSYLNTSAYNFPLRSVSYSSSTGNSSSSPTSYLPGSAGPLGFNGSTTSGNSYPGVTPTGLPLLATPLTGAGPGGYGGYHHHQQQGSGGTITLINPSSSSSSSGGSTGSGNGDMVSQHSGASQQGSSRPYF